jgi:hypothetical protein
MLIPLKFMNDFVDMSVEGSDMNLGKAESARHER